MVGTLVRGCRCATSWCHLDLTFDLAVVMLSLKILSGIYHEIVRCWKLILGRVMVRGCRCATSWCDLDLTFDLVVVTMNFKILSGFFLDSVRLKVDTW